MTDDLNLYPLRIFQVVARLGSVTKAAEELNVRQPAVSAHLRTLETRYGEPLFERTPRGMVLTPTGKVVMQHADRLFAQIDDLKRAVESARGQIRGDLTIAASTIPGAYLLPALLRQFCNRYPLVDPNLLVGHGPEALGWLSDFRAQIALVGEMPLGESMEQIRIAQDELRLMAGPEDPICRYDVINHRSVAGRTLFISEQSGSGRLTVDRLLGDLLGSFGRIVELPNNEVVKQAVSSRLGIAVLSTWSTRLEERAKLLQSVGGPTLRCSRSFYLVRRTDRQLLGASAAFWAYLVHFSAEKTS